MNFEMESPYPFISARRVSDEAKKPCSHAIRNEKGRPTFIERPAELFGSHERSVANLKAFRVDGERELQQALKQQSHFSHFAEVIDFRILLIGDIHAEGSLVFELHKV